MTDSTGKQAAPSGLQFTEAHESKDFLKSELDKKQALLSQLKMDSDPLERAKLQYEIADIMLDAGGAGMPEAAWGLAKEAFRIYMDHEDYEAAVNCCDLLYRTDLPGSVVALGNGMWLAVTYPVDPELSIIMMNNLIDDTPPKSDGAAVAAVTAHYIADLRLQGEKRDSVMFLTMNMISKVAERHSNVTDQQQMNFWMEKLDLNDPAKFLPRLGQVIDAIVAGDWWYDRDDLRSRLPVN